MIEFRHDPEDAEDVLEATEQRLARLIAQRDRNGTASFGERLAITRLERAVRIQRIALFGDADVAPRAVAV